MTAIVASERPLSTGAADEGRRARLASFAAALALHAAILAAALAGFAGEKAETDPEPLVVDLVVETPGSAGAAGNAAGAAGGTAGPAAAVPAGAVSEPSVAGVPTPVPLPRPRDVAVRNRLPGASVQHHPKRAIRPAAAAQPVAPDLATGATAEPPSVLDAEPVALPPAEAGDTLVASLGTAAGGGTSPAGGGGSGSAGRGGASGTGATHGPGFAAGTGANPMPPYPPAARRRGIEGIVLLQVQVAADGRALLVEIARSSGSALLDEAARETVRRWRFRPAKHNGETVAAVAMVPVQFSLTDG